MALKQCLPCGCPRLGYAARKAGGYIISRSTYSPSCALGTHAHAEDRVVLTLRGGFDAGYGSRTFALDRWRAIYRPARIEHRDAYEQETVCLTIRLPAAERAGSEAFIVLDEELAGIAGRLAGELDASDSDTGLVIEALSAQIAARVQSRRDIGRPGCRWIREIRERVEDEYADPPTLAALAGAVGREASYVANAFKRTYGKSIGDYVREVRLWRTRKLVEDSSIPLAEVAQRGGFADQSHFARLFKRRFAMTPGEYRRRLLLQECFAENRKSGKW
jgi:AraC family transcriptional regulator